MSKRAAPPSPITKPNTIVHALETLRLALVEALPPGVRVQWIEREFLPQFVFGKRDMVVALGPDGLVVNIAKYLDSQVLVAFNPAPARNDGVLLPFAVWLAEPVLRRVARVGNCFVINDGALPGAQRATSLRLQTQRRRHCSIAPLLP